MITSPSGARVWIAAGVTDMRKGMDGLAAIVQTALGERPFSGDVFVFPRPTRRPDQAALVDGHEPVRQAPGARALRVAAGNEWGRSPELGAAVDAARRN